MRFHNSKSEFGYRFNAPTFTASLFKDYAPSNVTYPPSTLGYLHPCPRLTRRRFGTNAGAATKAASERAARNIQLPPAAPRKVETSPRKISQFGVFTSYQANVDGNGNNILGDAANEPSIAVDPTDRNKMSIGWRQFDSIISDFRQAGWGYTTDGGDAWTFPGVLQNDLFRSDPVLHFNEVGNFFYLSLRSDGLIFLRRRLGFIKRRPILGTVTENRRMEETRNGSP